MADLIAILAVGLQYWLIFFIVYLCFGNLMPIGGVVAIFAILASVGLAFWHKRESWKTSKQWRKPILASLVLGVFFFAFDSLLGYLDGKTNPFLFGGGLLGIPLTLATCPGFTIICVAGLVRAMYIARSENRTALLS